MTGKCPITKGAARLEMADTFRSPEQPLPLAPECRAEPLQRGDEDGDLAAITRLWRETERGLLFANIVDFDMLFGHHCARAGYAQALAEFDAWLPSFLEKVTPHDLVMLTADHGNDPTWSGTDHTREEVPLLVVGHLTASRIRNTMRHR